MRITNFIQLSFFLVILAACGLTPSQEENLSRDFSKYIQSLENCQTLLEVSLTHPTVVKTIRSRGDEAFKKRFFCNANRLWFKFRHHPENRNRDNREKEDERMSG